MGMPQQGVKVGYVQQVMQESAIAQVTARMFYDPLEDIFLIGRAFPPDERAMGDINIFPCRGGGYPQ